MQRVLNYSGVSDSLNITAFQIQIAFLTTLPQFWNLQTITW